MQRPNPNLPHLELIAQALGDLRERGVFVLNIVNGRPALPEELIAPSHVLRQAVTKIFADFLANPDFNHCLPVL